ncbi:MAG: ATP-binding protein [Gammaproteobacteria bacterium]|nr:ATP-binding protein [Gammaproteobacteria bacterium]
MKIDWNTSIAAIWRQRKNQLHPVVTIDPVSLNSLIGIEDQKNDLIENTERFINKLPANNALLWGARGTGKSSLIKAVLNEYKSHKLRLIEIYKNELHNLPEIVDEIRDLDYRFIVYCDDFSFEDNENTYVVLKSILDGSIEPPPENVLLYVTSNRRHLMPEYMKDNLDTKIVDGEVHYSDAVEERISLSDRFGLWLSFYPPTIEDYINIVDSYFPEYQGDKQKLHKAALSFAQQRASKSGRTAKQFYNSYAGKE